MRAFASSAAIESICVALDWVEGATGVVDWALAVLDPEDPNVILDATTKASKGKPVMTLQS